MRILYIFLMSFLVACGAADTSGSSGPMVVAHGGGDAYTFSSGGSVTLMNAFAYPIRYAGGRSARIVTVSSAETDTDNSLKTLLRRAGFRNVYHLIVTDPAAVSEIMAADVVYFDGGVQTRLMRKLRANPAILDAIRTRYQQGAVVAGISAGAAAMSDVMICCDRGGRAIESRGLGLLSNIVIDQHYSQRHREFRLNQVIAAHPNLVGVGIDEGMAVVFQGNTARVIGAGGKVTVVTSSGGEIQTTVLRSGTFEYAN